MEISEPVDLIDQGLVPELKKGSATTQVLSLLMANESGLTHAELTEMTGLNKKTLDAAIWRLSQIESTLTKLGLRLRKLKTTGNWFRYYIERTGAPAPTLEGHAFIPVTRQMQQHTKSQAAAGIAYERGLQTTLPLEWEMDETLANPTIRNATWAFSVPQGEQFAVRHIMKQALAGNAVRTTWIRNGWAAKDGKSWDGNFFHELEKTTNRYAPELGFVIRCVDELEARGVVMGAFLDPEFRRSLHLDAPPLKRAGLETCFDRVGAFDPEECRKRVEEAKIKPRVGKFPFQLFEAVIKDQRKGVERSAVSLSQELGIKREIVQRWVMVSIDNRKDWGIYLRSKTGNRGLECALYEGALPL